MMPEIDRRQQILAAALKVFATQGYHKASIKKIAAVAGIKSPALIYHYFEDKQQLLSAIVTEATPARDLPFLKPELQGQIFALPPEVLLTQLAMGVLSLLDDEDISNLLRVFISEAARVPEVADALIDTQQKMLRLLEQFLTYHIEQSTLRPHDPHISARAFVGLMVVNLMANVVFTQLKAGFPDRATYVKEVVQIYLVGLRNTP